MTPHDWAHFCATETIGRLLERLRDGETPSGIHYRVDPGVDPTTIEFRDPATGELRGTIVNLETL